MKMIGRYNEKNNYNIIVILSFLNILLDIENKQD
jgi:hypothetical protein